jgi:hypothetical protein
MISGQSIEKTMQQKLNALKKFWIHWEHLNLKLSFLSEYENSLGDVALADKSPWEAEYENIEIYLKICEF